MWKREFVSHEIRYLAEELSKQSIEGVAWLVLPAYSKMQKKRNADSRVYQNESELADIAKFLAYPYHKKKKKRKESLFWREE